MILFVNVGIGIVLLLSIKQISATFNIQSYAQRPNKYYERKESICLSASCSNTTLLIAKSGHNFKTSSERLLSDNCIQNLKCRGGSNYFGSPDFLKLLLPWLYFMAVQINTATLPSYVHRVIADSNIEEKTRISLSKSATIYGNMCGIDSLFTFFSVNLLGCLSDYTRSRHNVNARWFKGFGRTRRPYMFLSSFGLGISQLMLLHASSISKTLQLPPENIFYAASAIDGITSCMLSQAQAHIADSIQSGSDLSAALSRFQGIAIGSAFFIGAANRYRSYYHEI